MKNLAITVLLALVGISGQAQTSETRRILDFTTLEVKNGIEVVFTQLDTPGLIVETDTKANLEQVITENNSGTLKIYLREGNENQKSNRIHKAVKVYVAQKNVTTFKASTGSSIKLANELKMEDVTIKLASGASFTGILDCKGKCTIKAESGSAFRGKLTADSFKANITGGACVKITGDTKSAIVYCNGGSFQAGKFMSQMADVKTINASTASVYASKSISANTDSSSTITYFGEPIDINLGSNSYAIKRDNVKLALN